MVIILVARAFPVSAIVAEFGAHLGGVALVFLVSARMQPQTSRISRVDADLSGQFVLVDGCVDPVWSGLGLPELYLGVPCGDGVDVNFGDGGDALVIYAQGEQNADFFVRWEPSRTVLDRGENLELQQEQ